MEVTVKAVVEVAVDVTVDDVLLLMLNIGDLSAILNNRYQDNPKTMPVSACGTAIFSSRILESSITLSVAITNAFGCLAWTWSMFALLNLDSSALAFVSVTASTTLGREWISINFPGKLAQGVTGVLLS